MIVLHLTEGLWECEKKKNYTRTPRGLLHIFYVQKRAPPATPPLPDIEEKSGSRWLFPHVNPPHKFSLVAVLYNTQLLNIAIRELSHCHYIEYIIILAALSLPAHRHYSLSLCPFFLS